MPTLHAAGFRRLEVVDHAEIATDGAVLDELCTTAKEHDFQIPSWHLIQESPFQKDVASGKAAVERMKASIERGARGGVPNHVLHWYHRILDQRNDGHAGQHWLPGQGVINFPRLFDSLADVGFEGLFFMEVNPWCEAPQQPTSLLQLNKFGTHLMETHQPHPDVPPPEICTFASAGYKRNYPAAKSPSASFRIISL